MVNKKENRIATALKIESLRNHFKGKNSFTTDDIADFYSDINPEIPKTTVNWRVYELIQKGIIQRVYRGVFTLGKMVVYSPQLDNRSNIISKTLVKHFPFIDYCIWDTRLINEFAHHQISMNYLILEVEREVLDSVCNLLRKDIKQIVKHSNDDIFYDIIETLDSPIIIKPLVSESPVQVIENTKTVTVEKLLVDIIADKQLLSIPENETHKIVQNAFERYTVNKSKLFRYAWRRGKKEEINNILKTIKRQ